MTLTQRQTDGFHLPPMCQSERVKSLLVCRRIAHVKISDSIRFDGTTYYRMQIFYEKPTDGIPAGKPTAGSGSVTDAPDVIALQRFSAFADLTHELSDLAEDGHIFQLCRFCQSLTSSLRRDRPRTRTKLFRDDAKMYMQLERLINSALVLVQANLHMSSHNCCDAHYEAPILLALFLSGTTDAVTWRYESKERLSS